MPYIIRFIPQFTLILDEKVIENYRKLQRITENYRYEQMAFMTFRKAFDELRRIFTKPVVPVKMFRKYVVF